MVAAGAGFAAGVGAAAGFGAMGGAGAGFAAASAVSVATGAGGVATGAIGSGALAGFAGGLYVHLQPLTASGVYLDLTFITLAMLVVGGSGSLLGAVVGALAVSGLDSFLSAAVNGVDVFGWQFHVGNGTPEIVVGALMAIVLILRPAGITGGRELSLPRRRRPVADLEKARATT